MNTKFAQWLLNKNIIQFKGELYECVIYKTSYSIGVESLQILDKSLNDLYKEFLKENPSKPKKVLEIEKDSLKETCGGCPMIWEGRLTSGEDIYIRIRWSGLNIVNEDTNESIFSVGTSSYGVDGVCSEETMIEIVEKESLKESIQIKFV